MRWSYNISDTHSVNMFLFALVTIFFVPLVLGQTDLLDQECNILQTLEALQDRLTTAEADVTNLKGYITEQAAEITTLKSTLETELENLNSSQMDSSQTPRVLFNVRDISSQPTQHNPFLFLDVVENIGDAYNITTGCFTAPTRAAYWFYSQICAWNNAFLNPCIYRQGVLIIKGRVGDPGFLSCGSVTALVTLEAGDEICLKPDHVSPNAVWMGATNNFMGTIIN